MPGGSSRKGRIMESGGASMMSEESDDDDPQLLKRRCPSWRSDQQNDLIDTIDMQTETRSRTCFWRGIGIDEASSGSTAAVTR